MPLTARALRDTKRELTSRQWPDMNAYADAKTDVIKRSRPEPGAGGME